MDTNQNEKSRFHISKKNFFLVIVPLFIAIIGGTYKVAYDFGNTKPDSQKTNLEKENAKLKEKIESDSLLIRELKEDTKEENIPPQSVKIAQTRKQTVVVQTQGYSDMKERADFLQRKLEQVEKEKKAAIAENKELKKEIYGLKSDLKDVQKLLELLKEETDKTKKLEIETQILILLEMIKLGLNKVAPEVELAPITVTDTITVIQTQTITNTITNYEELGDQAYSNAKKSLDNKDVKRRARPENIQNILNSYEEALEYYKKADNVKKIKEIEIKIKEFKRQY